MPLPTVSPAGRFTYTPAAGTVLARRATTRRSRSLHARRHDRLHDGLRSNDDQRLAIECAAESSTWPPPTPATRRARRSPGRDGSTHYVGFDAFGTIQAGINAVAAGGTVNVAAGTYTEQLTIRPEPEPYRRGGVVHHDPGPTECDGDEIEIASGAQLSRSPA